MSYYQSTAISASDMKYLVNGWEEFIQYKQEPRKETTAMKKGTDIHSFLLEGEGEVKMFKRLRPFFKQFVSGAEIEKEIYNEMFGIECRSKIDVLTKNEIYDLKTISNIDSIEYNIENFGYRLQMAFYELMADVDSSYLIFVEKSLKGRLIPRIEIITFTDLFREKEIIEQTILDNYDNIINYQKGKL